MCFGNARPAQGPNSRPADLLLDNGRVIMVDDNFSIASAMAVKDGRILAVSGSDLRDQFHAEKEFDLHGRTLMPGFDVAHIHIEGTPKNFIDLTNTDSIAQLQIQIRAKIREFGTGKWVTGADWNEFNFSQDGRHPPRSEGLDVTSRESDRS